jgi:signal transduction histidine kinase
MIRLRVKLRLRVAAGFALLGLAVSLALGGWLYLASSDLEQRLIDEALGAELEDYQARLARNPKSLPPDTATIRGFVTRPDGAGDQTPPALRDLPNGRHTLDLDGVSYRVLRRERPDGDLVMLHNRTQVERREERFALMLILGMTLTTLLSAAGGWWLAGRVIAPVRELAERVRGRDPAAGPMTAVDDAADALPYDEVGELAQTIEGYVQRLRAFVERERAFVSNASHELRTPLAVIQGAVEVLKADPRLDDRTQERLDRIARATRGMTDLTTALLMLAREGRTGPAPSCPVDRVLAEVVELHRPLLLHKPVVLECVVKAHPVLAVERPLLAIALGNLLRNACAYTEQGQVTITLDATGLRVDDTGPGIPAEELPCLFEQGPGCRRQARGEGIGLPLVKRIADHQGWGISAENRPEEGASFRLEFLPGPGEASRAHTHLDAPFTPP